MAEQSQRDLLNPSELGTKEYWDNIYNRELQNHQEDDDDEGTIWFSESNAEATVLEQLDRLAEARLIRRNAEDSLPASRFLDLGTGNGHMLFQLREPDDEDYEPWSGEMVGVDYSTASVQLAQRIAEQRRDRGALHEIIRFECWDLLNHTPGDWLEDGFDVVLDKGTFDAISLMNQENGALHPCETFRRKVAPLLRPGGFLVVTSCNWTKSELQGWLGPEGSELVFYGEATYPTFTFGGKTGQSIVTVVFRRKEG